MMAELSRFIDTQDDDDVVGAALEAVRNHLGMSVAYLSEFVGEETVFRAVQAPGLDHLLKAGDARSIHDVYCPHIISGRLPRLIPDTASEPLAAAMPITEEVPIGSHVSVPIHRDDGSVYGMFCCLDPKPNTTLNERDLRVMEVFAQLTAREINRSIHERSAREEIRSRIRQAIDDRDYDIWLQPIVDLKSGMTAGFEALSRFRGPAAPTPDVWFREAAEVGALLDLELATIEAALEIVPQLPGDLYLSINASPSTVSSGRVCDLLAGRPGERLVIEVTEHDAVEDYTALKAAMIDISFKGPRFAIDDAGAGYCGLSHFVQLSPDIIKLDISLIRGIHTDPARRALAAAMVHFARETRVQVVAEGIETVEELGTLRGLGVDLGQGYLLGRPAPVKDALTRTLARTA